MKDQVHNQGELKELKVKVEKDVVDSFERMCVNANMKLEDMVVIALKRYRASHSDWDHSPKEKK